MIEECIKVGLKIHKEKTNKQTNKQNPTFIPNIDATDNKQIEETGKVTNYKYLEQTVEMDKRTRHEVLIRIKAERSVFWKVHRNLSRQAPSHGPKKKSLQLLCLTNNEIRMSNMPA